MAMRPETVEAIQAAIESESMTDRLGRTTLSSERVMRDREFKLHHRLVKFLENIDPGMSVAELHEELLEGWQLRQTHGGG
jgi:hypothetical protein